jgi:hypothetical protein
MAALVFRGKGNASSLRGYQYRKKTGQTLMPPKREEDISIVALQGHSWNLTTQKEIDKVAMNLPAPRGGGANPTANKRYTGEVFGF